MQKNTKKIYILVITILYSTLLYNMHMESEMGRNINENIDWQNHLGFTPLMLAIVQGHSNDIHYFLNIGANTNICDSAGKTALHRAVANKKIDQEITQRLIEKSSNINIATKTGDTPLHMAAVTSNVPAIEMLLRNGANIDAQNARGLTPIMCAVLDNNITTIQLLFKRKANLHLMYEDFDNGQLQTILHLAESSHNPNKEIINFLKSNTTRR